MTIFISLASPAVTPGAALAGCLCRAAKVPLLEASICCLPLKQLQQLHSLSMTLTPGEVPQGTLLPLPSHLQQLDITAATFCSGINPLPLQQLQHLTSLRVEAADSSGNSSGATEAAGAACPAALVPGPVLSRCQMSCTPSRA